MAKITKVKFEIEIEMKGDKKPFADLFKKYNSVTINSIKEISSETIILKSKEDTEAKALNTKRKILESLLNPQLNPQRFKFKMYKQYYNVNIIDTQCLDYSKGCDSSKEVLDIDFEIDKIIFNYVTYYIDPQAKKINAYIGNQEDLDYMSHVLLANIEILNFKHCLEGFYKTNFNFIMIDPITFILYNDVFENNAVKQSIIYGVARYKDNTTFEYYTDKQRELIDYHSFIKTNGTVMYTSQFTTSHIYESKSELLNSANIYKIQSQNLLLDKHNRICTKEVLNKIHQDLLPLV